MGFKIVLVSIKLLSYCELKLNQFETVFVVSCSNNMVYSEAIYCHGMKLLFVLGIGDQIELRKCSKNESKMKKKKKHPKLTKVLCCNHIFLCVDTVTSNIVLYKLLTFDGELLTSSAHLKCQTIEMRYTC